MKFNAADILAISPGANPAIVAAIVQYQSYLEASGIVQSVHLAFFLGQAAAETQGFTRLEENLFYTSAARLMQVWPGRFRTEPEAAPFVRNPRALANKVYGGRFGNTEPDDGFNYRGSGLLQTTFRDNFAEVERVTGRTIKCVATPGLLRALPEALIAAAIFWKVRNLNTYAEADNIVGLTKAIQGGSSALAERQTYTNRALARFKSSGTPATVPDASGWFRNGSTGPGVEALQKTLQSRGYYVGGVIDGRFGDGTEKAVVEFQRDHGLNGDGVVGPKTAQALASPDIPVSTVGPIGGAGAQTGQGRPISPAPVQPTPEGAGGLLAMLLRLIAAIFGKGKA